MFEGKDNCGETDKRYNYLMGIDEASTVIVPECDVEAASKYTTCTVKGIPFWCENVVAMPDRVSFKIGNDSYSLGNIVGVFLDSKEIHPNETGTYEVSDLRPGHEYTVNIKYRDDDNAIRLLQLHIGTSLPKFNCKGNPIKKYMGQLDFTMSTDPNLPITQYEYGLLYKTKGIYYACDAEGTVHVTDLMPSTYYSDEFFPYVKIGGEYYLGQKSSSWPYGTTEPAKFTFKYKAYHRAVEITSAEFDGDGTFTPDYIEVDVSGSDRNVLFEKLPHIWEDGDLSLGKETYVEFRYYKGDEVGYWGEYISVPDLGISFSADKIGPTSAEISLDYNDSRKYSGKEKQYMYTVEKVEAANAEINGVNKISYVGLEPDADNSINVIISAVSHDEKSNYTQSATYDFKTKKLELTTEQPRMPSEGSAIASARTNVSDKDTGVGFQWRKYDAPSTVAPNEGYAAVYDGVAEGYIRNLQSDHYYNLRAFYKSAAGKYYYSDWLTFDPSDFSYFEPIVHTYPVEYTTATTTDVRGYVMPGSDAVTEQGFEYWPVFSSEKKQRLMLPAPADAEVVFSSGQVMTARLQGLEPGQQYEVRSFVTAAGSTYYGETQSFATEELSGVGNVTGETPVEPVAYFDMSGRRFAAPQQGLNIVVYSDGTIEKIYFR